MSVQLEAIIFDLDGVITDTAEFQFLSWKRLTEEEGIPFDRSDNDKLRGVTRRESLRRILNGQHISESTAHDWMERKNRYYLEYLDVLTAADRTPGLTQLIEDAKARHIKLGIATASRNAHAVLGKLALETTFDVIGDPDSIVNPKPAPDLFIWVAGYLHAHIGATLVVEDSLDGIIAAKKAGFWTLGLGKGLHKDAHICVQTLSELSLAEIEARLSQDQVHQL